VTQQASPHDSSLNYVGGEGHMVTVVATLIVLALMLVPILNMLVGALAWGPVGFCIGLVITMVIGVMST
jgi:hypothetical protein